METFKQWLAKLSVLTCLTLSSCSYLPKEQAKPAEENTETSINPSREAIYTYSENSLPDEIRLNLGAEPVLLDNSYIRLSGIAGDVALVEVGGKGGAVAAGSQLGDYRVAALNEKSILLKRIRK